MLSESFKKRADEAAFWEAWVGTVLSRGGLYTLHHPFTADGSPSHALTWDLEVGSKPQNLLTVEVKSLKLTFTGPADYPFSELLVCSGNSWKKKWGDSVLTQRDFLFVSRATGAIVWLPIGVTCGVATVTDKERGETYKTVVTDSGGLKHLSEFVDHVKEEDPGRGKDSRHLYGKDGGGGSK